jgi:septal ring factor EnvC (AmiA/AmiB activator)
MLMALLLGVLLASHSGGGGVWFYGGATPHQMRKEVAKIESDGARRKLIDQTLDQMDKQINRVHSERAKLEKDVAKALASHDASREQFQALAARADAINTSSREVLLELRFALRDQLSEVQWQELFPAPAGHQAN